jgi:hypothetical protein
MKIVINPTYLHLNSFIENLPQSFDNGGQVIYKERNEIKIFETGGEQVIVKSFRIPHFFNRIMYSFFRRTKARRSYEHALVLEAKQINTPQPVAYIEIKKGGLFAKSYYISVYKAYPGILRELRTGSLEEKEDLLRSFARFTASIHEKNVLPLDYSPGNILYEKTENNYNFCLIDINRMRFTPVDMVEGARNFRRLWGSKEMIIFIVREYAKIRQFDSDECEKLALKYFYTFWKKYSRKHDGFLPYDYEEVSF